MRLQINAELEAAEVIENYFAEKLKAQGLSGDIKTLAKVQVQNKAGDWVEVSPEKVKFTWSNQ
jgi:hypothetical protein